MAGLDASAVVAPEDRAMTTENIRRRISGEADSVHYEFRGLRKDGSLIDVGVHGSATTIHGQRAIVGLVQDITERRKAEQRIKKYVGRLESAMVGTVEAISRMVDLRDPYTSGHERRVAEIAGEIGRSLGLEEQRVRGLQIAGRLHDIGKISVPAEILSKPTRLTSMEYEIVKLHACHGHEILEGVEFPWPIAEIAHQHHERLDGSGYPHGLKGDSIIPEARILAVADVIEAMSSHRPYRASLGIAPALAEIERGAGKLYDGDVANAALRLFRVKGYRLQD
jgi:HD-GYP domain-containing protein (c-di-GMP phosphodiesterase class II)